VYIFPIFCRIIRVYGSAHVIVLSFCVESVGINFHSLHFYTD
jgi:hypothetical protein